MRNFEFVILSAPAVAALFFAVIAVGVIPVADAGDGVKIGGNVTISTSTGKRTTTAKDGAVAQSCVGSVMGKSVTIAGDVVIKGNNAGCACEGNSDECAAMQTAPGKPDKDKN